MVLDASSSSQFTLSYEGARLADHSMSVRELGPALVAIGDLFDRSNVLINGDSATIDLKVTATQPASFDIALVVEMARLTTIMFGSPLITSALNLRQLIVVSFTLLKYFKGDNESYLNRADEQVIEGMENFEMRTEDFEISAQASAETMQSVLPTALQLLRDRPYRNCLRDVVDPMYRDGIDRLSIKDSGHELESAEKHDLPFFEPLPDNDGPENVTVSRRMLTVIAPYLGEGTGQWRLRDGNRTDYYNLRDDRFVESVKKRVFRFAVGDRLDCQVQYTQRSRTDREERIERDILRIFNHHPRIDGDAQLTIPDTE